MIFSELLIYCKVKAFNDLLSPTEDSLWRSFTRAYSERFHVALPEVRKMNPEEVISEILEAKYEETDAFEEVEMILEEIYKIENPHYERQQKVEMDTFIKNMEDRERKRLNAEKKREDVRASKLRPEKPAKSSGSVDFSKLDGDI